MVAAALERRRPRSDGLVGSRGVLAALLVPLLALALLAALAGGLLRAGVVLPFAAESAWLPRSALAHAALMMGAFMGSVIAVERAVALKHPLAWAAPVLSAVAGLALVLGPADLAGSLLTLAGAAFCAVNVALVRKQPAAHTWVLLAAAGCWLLGNALFTMEAGSAAIPWWFAFLLFTIAAERLEMTRLMRRRAGAAPALYSVLAALAAGSALSPFAPLEGGVLFGGSLLWLAVWLLQYDIARVTVRGRGLTRYMGACLLGGYAWLATGGIAWAAMAFGLPTRDAALHAIGLGFVVSMMLGHAPVILPAVARVKVLYGAWFYLPLAALHLSLAARLFLGAEDAGWRSMGAACNAAAIGLFALTVLGSALAWRWQKRA